MRLSRRSAAWGIVFPIAMLVGARGDAHRGAAYVVGGQRVGDLAGPDLRLIGQPAAVPGQDLGANDLLVGIGQVHSGPGWATARQATVDS
jgi:hypothetical protein